MRRCGLMLLLAALILSMPSLAFADAQTIDFGALFAFCHDRFYNLAGVTMYNPETADWTLEGGVGILDANEMELLALILANTSAPNHDAIHNAYKTNSFWARKHIGKTIVGLTTPSATSGFDRQPIPPGQAPAWTNDTALYYGADGLFGAYVTMGEYTLFDITLVGFKTSSFGGSTNWPIEDGLSLTATDTGGVIFHDRYDLTQGDLLNMCGDADADGALNCYEYWVANSYTNALNNAVTTVKAYWGAWACLDENNSSVKFSYNAANGRVYIGSSGEMTYDDALAYESIIYPGGTGFSVRLAEIRSEAENDFVFAATGGNTAWLGASDHGNDLTGTPGAVAADNHNYWYWLSTPTVIPMAYQNWRAGEPNGVNGGEDYATMRDDGTWNDVGKGAVDDPRMEYAVWESTVSFPDVAPANGFPDAFEDLNGNLKPDGFSEVLPDVDFSATPRDGDMPLPVTFTDLSTMSEPGFTITSWEWDFGDGSPVSTVQNPSHTYMAVEGGSSYSVTLTVVSTDGVANRQATETKTGFITVDYVCSWGADIPLQAAVVAADPGSFDADLATAVGVAPFAEWDLDGDLLPDEAQLALLAEIACATWHPLNTSVWDDLTANAALWEADFEGNTLLVDNAAFFAAMAGLSAEMQTALGTIFGVDLSGYALYGESAKAGETFSAAGDLDGDDITNLEEYNEVMGTTCDDLATFVEVALDPDNFYPCNPLLPVAGIVGLGLLVGSILTGAAFALRKK